MTEPSTLGVEDINSSAINQVERIIELANERLGAKRLGKSITRETDADLLVLKTVVQELKEVIRISNNTEADLQGSLARERAYRDTIQQARLMVKQLTRDSGFFMKLGRAQEFASLLTNPTPSGDSDDSLKTVKGVAFEEGYVACYRVYAEGSMPGPVVNPYL